uniref:RNA-directed DNA polymerase n=1 Tax=Oryza sativa subsp. japonica TaxID=39947 RepID=Q6ATH7_ORYSJ|nr:putative polyprotein [Oryza sativa Japonica Group]
MTKPPSKTEVEPSNVMPVTLDDFEGEDRKAMEEYINELTREALMRATTRTRQGVIIKPGPRPKLAPDVDKVDGFLRNRLGSLMDDYTLKDKAYTTANPPPIDQTSSKTDGTAFTAGPTGPDGRSDRDTAVGPTSQTAGQTGYYPGGQTGSQAGPTAHHDAGQTGSRAGQTGTIVPIQAIDPMTNASYLYHFKTFDPPVSTATSNPQVPPHIPNAYKEASRGYPPDTRHGQYNHIAPQTQPIRPPNLPPNQQGPNNMEDMISDVIRNKFGIETRNRARTYKKTYPDYYDNVPFPQNYRVPEFAKFSGEDGKTTWEHVGQFLAQCGEANSDTFKLRLFSLSLSGNAFTWFTSLPANSIHTWAQLEEQFHDYFYAGETELRLCDLTSVKQKYNESVIDYIKRFRDVRNQCYTLNITDRDLAGLAFNGLVALLRERLDGQQFLDVSQLMQRALAQESRVKDNRKLARPFDKKPNVNVVDYPKASDSEEEGDHDIYVAEWSWTNKNKPFVCSNLMPTPRKDRQSEVKYRFDVAKCDKIFDYLLQEKQIRLPKGHVIPSQEELKRRAYCKWHDSHSHSTNDCNVFRRQVQSAIDEGRLKFTDGSKMKLDHDPFPVNTINFNDKKVLIRPEQAESTKGKEVVIGEPRSRMIVPKKPEVGVWKENRSGASTSKAPRKTKVTFDMLLEKYEKQGEKREGKRVKVEERTSEVITIKVGSHDVPIPSGDGVGKSPSKKSEAGTSSSQSAGLTRPFGRSDCGHAAGLTGPSGRSDRRPDSGPTDASGRFDRVPHVAGLIGLQRRFDERIVKGDVRASSSSSKVNKGHYLPPGTEPNPRWMPKDLTATQKRRLQRLRAQELREKKTEEQRDKRFNELQPPPVWRPKSIEKAKPIDVEEKEEQSVDKSESSPKEDMDINMFCAMDEAEVAQFSLGPKDAVFEKPDESNRHMKPLYLKGHVDGKPVSRMLVDGGAAVNLMPYSLFKKLGREDDELKKTNMILNGFNGEPTEARGIFSAELTVGNKTLPTAFFIVDVQEANLEWLQKRVQEYRSTKNDIGETVEDFDEVEKLGQGFTLADPLEEVDIGDGTKPRPTFVNKNMRADYKVKIIELLKEYADCFAWEYHEIPGLSRELVEHRFPIKSGFRPYKQPPHRFNPLLYDRVKEEIDRLLKAGFIRPCRYAEWVSSIVPVEKKESGKIRVCIDFRDLNKATPKDEYPMPIADMMINDASGHKVISFLDGNAGYNQIFMAEEDMYKTAFRCPGFVGLFEWVVMTFGLKNAGATYQRAINLIFHDLLGVILEIYIDDIVVKSDEADFTWGAKQQEAFEELKRYLSTPPVVRAPKAGKPFRLYIASEDKVIGAVLTQEEDGKEYIITYLSRRLLDAETRPILSGRIGKWAYALIEYDLAYEPLKSMKGQIVCDFIIDHHIDCAYEGEVCLVEVIPWKIYFNGSSCKEGQGIGVVLFSPNGMCYEASARLEYYCTNNQAEYNALLFGLQVMEMVGAKYVEAFGDSELVVQQVAGVYKCLDGSLNRYLDSCLDIIANFDNFAIRHIARRDNSRANDLAQQASSYNVKRGLFLILEEPVLDFRSLCEIGKIRDQGRSDRHFTAGLTGNQGRSDWPHATGLTGNPERSNRPCVVGLTGSGQNAGGHVSINLEAELIVNSDVCAQEIEGDWRIPLIQYLKDPTLKVDRKIRRQAFKYTLLDGDLYRRNIDGVLLKCLDGDLSKVAMGEGHRFVLVATDYFTKWAEAVPLKYMTHTEANGQAESSNKTLLKLVKRKIVEYPKRWHEVLSEALWAHRISKHGATRVTPFELAYGQEAVLPVEVNLGSLHYIKQDDLSSEDYKMLMGDNLDEVIDKRLKALEEIEKEKKRVAKAYNKRVKAKLFQVGDLVWKTILPLGTRSKEFGKWSPSWEGPYRVCGIVRGNAYFLEALQGERFQRAINGKYLKKYFPSVWQDA